MKSFKLWQLPGFVLCLLLGLVFFSSCDKDEDEAGGGGIIGYWLPLTDIRDEVREGVEEDLFEEDGNLGIGFGSYRFLNANTVEIFYTNCYLGRKSAAFHTETISGKTVSFVADNVRTYTYVRDGNKVYITNGTIGTFANGELRVDGLRYTFQKLK